MTGHGQKRTAKQEALIAALLEEPTHALAAFRVGIGESTVRRWLRLPAFARAYRRARKALVQAALGRLETASGIAVDALVSIAKDGKDSDRIRAAIGILAHAVPSLRPERRSGDAEPMAAADVMRLLATRLRQLDRSDDLGPVEQARTMTTVADALLRALGVHELAGKLEALQAVLANRKEPAP